jgi:hypothetical protein
MRKCCTDRCPCFSRFCRAVVLRVLSMRRCISTFALLVPLTVDPHQAVLCIVSRKDAPLAASAVDMNSSCLPLSTSLHITSCAPNLRNSYASAKSLCISFWSSCRPSRCRTEQANGLILLIRQPRTITQNTRSWRGTVFNAVCSQDKGSDLELFVRSAACTYVSACASRTITHSCQCKLFIHGIILFQLRSVEELQFVQCSKASIEAGPPTKG